MNSWIVNATLVLLVLLSTVTWTIAIVKFRELRKEAEASRAFLDVFLSKPSWSDLRQASRHAQASDCGRLAVAGIEACTEWALDEAGMADREQASGDLERNLSLQMQTILRRREAGMTVLASIGSTAPFVGLFGTVWGIMDAMTVIGTTGEASIDVVAGPIGEALIATAIGILTAIPGVLAYNYFLRRLRVHVTELERFQDQFVRFALRWHNAWRSSQ